MIAPRRRRAVRVSKAGHGRYFAVHWLADDEETVCRLELDRLVVVDELELERLPELEGCGTCRRIVDGWKPSAPSSSGYWTGNAHTAEPAPGRMRTVGPLSHGLRRRKSRNV